MCVYVFISVHACGASPSQSHLVLDFSICFSAGERPGVEGEEITQHAQAEFSRTKTIWVKVTQWNSVGSAALSHHPATMLWCTWVEASSFFSQKRNQRGKREGGREGGIYLKALNFFFFFYPSAMFIDGSFPEYLNNGFGQHILRVHWRPWFLPNSITNCSENVLYQWTR